MTFVRTVLLNLNHYPNLAVLGWQMHRREFTRQEIFELIENQWRYIDHANLNSEEKQLLQSLADEFSQGVFLV